MRSRALAVIAALVALVALLSLVPAALAGPQVRELPRVAQAQGFWTAERMAGAPPLELMRGGGDPAGRLRLGDPAPEFISAEVATPTTAPYNTNGRLFGVLKGFGAFSCSATSLDSAGGTAIMTAGHCIYDPRLGRFAKQLACVPAYTDGQTPFGIWPARTAAVTRSWVRHGNTNFDFAAIELATGPNGETIEGAVGGRVIALNTPVRQNYSAFGYPANLAGGERMWACTSPYAGRDPRPFRVGQAPVAIGCDMTGGASGGGWIGETGNLVSVSSFGYKRYPNLLFGARLGAAAAKLVKRVGG